MLQRTTTRFVTVTMPFVVTTRFVVTTGESKFVTVSKPRRRAVVSDPSGCQKI